MSLSLPEVEIDGTLRDIAAICGLNSSSTSETGPYFDAAHALLHMLDLPDSSVTTGRALPFTQSTRDAF